MLRETRRGKLEGFGELLLPQEAAEPILGRAVRGVLLEWLEEIWAEKDLAEVGVAPRKRMLLDGPPGVGKTTLAHHLAARLGVPMLAVRPEKIQSKYVGETGQLLGELFDLAARGVSVHDRSEPVPLVLFLDEFDSYSRQRRKSEQASDDARNEEVNVLLQRIEAFPGFLIAATNYADHVDQAIHRRFQLRLTLDMPGPEERALILKRYLAPFGIPAAILQRVATESFEGASPSLIREFCENLKRQLVIGPKLERDMARNAVLERVLLGCPPHPEVGKPRLWSFGVRDAAWQAVPWPLPRASEIVETAAAEVDADGAETMGASAFAAGTQVIDNPFAFGDPRRARWDKGWRSSAGGDGMGPADQVVSFPGRRP